MSGTLTLNGREERSILQCSSMYVCDSGIRGFANVRRMSHSNVAKKLKHSFLQGISLECSNHHIRKSKSDRMLTNVESESAKTRFLAFESQPQSRWVWKWKWKVKSKTCSYNSIVCNINKIKLSNCTFKLPRWPFVDHCSLFF